MSNQTTKQIWGQTKENFNHVSSQKLYSFSGSHWSKYSLWFKRTPRKVDTKAGERGYNTG